MSHGVPRPAAIVVEVIEIATGSRRWTAFSGRAAATLIRSNADRSARLEALDRLLLDVRAGRVDEFRTWPEDSTCVSITD
ncbi:hypothetical protein [Paraburkholderia sp. CNPSo 3281]|uniref:hypothetical protein n=1 Tax=Paraburkholderia sp. CNPSo 3281 TaxID=2940933 RepID=UPI0035CCEB58